MDIIYSRKRIKPPNFNRRTKALKLFKIIIILTIAFMTVNNSIKAIIPIFEQQCQNQAKSLLTVVSNNEATEVMKKYEYKDLFTVYKDKSENVTMISANIIHINQIISDIPVKIQNKINEQETGFNIRLGSLLGSRILSGRGPKIYVKITNIGNVETNLKSEFTSVGINQTKHRIYLELKCIMQAMTPYKTVESTIYNQILLAENIIVGTTPDTYYNLEGLEQQDAKELIE